MFPCAPQTFTAGFWRGQTRRFALALHNDNLLFWQPDSPQFQSEPQEWVFAVEEPILLAVRATLNSHFLVTVLQAALEDRTVGRMLSPSNDNSVFLHPRGTGSISSVQARGREDAACFLFAGGDEVFTQNSSFWLELLAQWTAEPESDFAFALSWYGKDAEERAQCLTQLSRGDWGEMEQVAQWILALEGHDHYLPHARMQNTLIVRLGYFDGQFSLRVSDEEDEFSTRRQSLWNEWLRFFGTSLQWETTERYTAASRSADGGFSWDYFRVSALLSQHERLENQLQLRDWLRDQAGLSDQRIAELLA